MFLVFSLLIFSLVFSFASPIITSIPTTTFQKISTKQMANQIKLGLDINQFDTDIGPQNLAKVLALAKGASAGFVRFSPGGGWQNINPSSGNYNWTGFDNDLSAAYRYGLKVLLEIGYEPSWDAYNSNPQAPPKDCWGYTNPPPSNWCQSVATFIGNQQQSLM